jgi:hypothetical protein
MANWRREGGIVEDGTLQREGALAADIDALCVNVLAGSWLEGIKAFVK